MPRRSARWFSCSAKGMVSSGFADGTARNVRAWRSFAISSLEQPLPVAMASAGHKIRGGQALRWVDVPIGDGVKIDPNVARDLSAATRTYYGTAGPAAIRHMFANGYTDNGGAIIVKRHREAKAMLMQGSEGEPALDRAAETFAYSIVGGEIMIEANIIPKDFPVREVVQWAWDAFGEAQPPRRFGPPLLMPIASSIGRCAALVPTLSLLGPLDKPARIATLAYYDQTGGILRGRSAH